MPSIAPFTLNGCSWSVCCVCGDDARVVEVEGEAAAEVEDPEVAVDDVEGEVEEVFEEVAAGRVVSCERFRLEDFLRSRLRELLRVRLWPGGVETNGLAAVEGAIAGLGPNAGTVVLDGLAAVPCSMTSSMGVATAVPVDLRLKSETCFDEKIWTNLKADERYQEKRLHALRNAQYVRNTYSCKNGVVQQLVHDLLERKQGKSEEIYTLLFLWTNSPRRASTERIITLRGPIRVIPSDFRSHSFRYRTETMSISSLISYQITVTYLCSVKGKKVAPFKWFQILLGIFYI